MKVTQIWIWEVDRADTSERDFGTVCSFLLDYWWHLPCRKACESIDGGHLCSICRNRKVEAIEACMRIRIDEKGVRGLIDAAADKGIDGQSTPGKDLQVAKSVGLKRYCQLIRSTVVRGNALFYLD